tara:strand:+ start:310 stop:1155 length:846 start_codon:yes stop_codon:yes gene_type:complete
MLIRIDIREQDLIQKIENLVKANDSFSKLEIKTEVLPIGDIIITDGEEDKLIIERKSITDLVASIKDGRYEEQSYRLNGINHHNHNIIYIIEGDVNRVKCFKFNNSSQKQTIYSAMFSLNYYKGFSVLKTISLDETAEMICNMAYKMNKEVGKQPYHQTLTATNDDNVETTIDCSGNIFTKDVVRVLEQSEKDYVCVVKKVKKENITPDNIGEIMLCQIPGVSSVTALAIMEKYKSLPILIKELDENGDCLNDIKTTTVKGQPRKINKTSILNIVKFLLKK